MNKHDRMYEAIEKHGGDLNAIFKTEMDNITLAKKLHSLEVKTHKLAEDYCNGENNIDTDNWETLTDALLVKVDKITNYKKLGVPVFVNGDARGYALKIEDSYIREKEVKIYKDWGGYGILAPDFNQEA